MFSLLLAFCKAAGEGGGVITGNKTLPLVIPLTTAKLFLTNLIKNYTMLSFLESVLLNKYKINQDRKNAPFGAALLLQPI